MSALALALLMAAAPPSPPQLSATSPTIELTADRAELGLDSRHVLAEGGVVLRSGGLLLRADELEYDQGQRQALGRGQLLIVDGNVALAADRGELTLGGDGLRLERARLYQKSAAQLPALYGAANEAAARGMGANALVLSADELERVAKGRYLASQLRLTPCDCSSEIPDWELGASSADIEAGDRAILSWPRLYLHGVPVLILPALYVPLSSRRTGLLFPRMTVHQSNGFVIDQPFFLTLGQSYDLTLTAGYRFGKAPDGQRPGTRGPHAVAELRYAPAAGTSGGLSVNYLQDLNGDRAQDLSAPARRGPRGQLLFHHATESERGLNARALVNLVKDDHYLSDESVNVFDNVPYLRSQAWAGWRGQDALVATSSAYYQDLGSQELAPYFGARPPTMSLFGPDAPATIQRPLSLLVAIAPVPLAGALAGAFEASATRYQSLLGLAGRLPLSQSLWSLSRVSAQPTLNLPLLRSDALLAGAWASARGEVSSYDQQLGDGAATRWQGRGLAGLWLGSELSRVFGSGPSALRHFIVPRLELRAGTRLLGESPVFGADVLRPVDELDMLPGGFAQAVASLSTRLTRRDGGQLLRLDAGQGFDLLTGRTSDAFARLELHPGIVNFSAATRYDLPAKVFSSINAQASVADSRGDSISAGYDYLRLGGNTRLQADFDRLFGTSLLVDEAVRRVLPSQMATVGASVSPFKGLSLRYGSSIRTGPLDPGTSRFVQHTLGLSLGTSCDCWRLDLFANVPPGAGWAFRSWNYGFLLDLKNFGSFGG